MAASARNIACFALFVSILGLLALQDPSCIDQRGSTGTSAGTTTAAGTVSASASTPPPLFDDGARKAAAMLALAGMEAVLIATAVIYSRHTHHAAGAGTWRVSELAFFVLFLQAGVLLLVLFVQEPAAATVALGINDDVARALPCVASVTFFLGITLIYAYAHVGNAGGAAGGGIAGNGPAPAPAIVRLLAGMTLGAALVCLMSIVLAF